MGGKSPAAGRIRTTAPGTALQIVSFPAPALPVETAGTGGVAGMGRATKTTPATAAQAAAVALPTSTAVELSLSSMAAARPGEALERARTLWASLLDAGIYPTADQTVELLADFQFMAIRDRLIADIPGIDEPMPRILLGLTEQPPSWSRLEWAEQVLLHLYTNGNTNGAPRYVAPVLLAVGYISWWQGRGSKAIQFMELALEADPYYPLALLVRQMLRSGVAAGWTPAKHKAYRSI